MPRKVKLAAGKQSMHLLQCKSTFAFCMNKMN